jgi:peptide/nickel transport system substrate-binding protein
LNSHAFPRHADHNVHQDHTMSAVFSRRRFVAGSAALAGLPSQVFAQDKNYLRIALAGFPSQKGNAYGNIQTPSIIVTSALFDGLTRLKADGSVMPALAASWEQRDGLTWRFKLREDVVFSNGKPFTADAAVHAVNYLANPGPATETVRRDMTFLAGAKGIDRFTVDIATKIPMPLLPRYLAVLFMVEPEAWTRMGVAAFADNPVGTGPMVAESWSPGRILFRANTVSNFRKPSIAGVDFRLVPDIPARLQAMLSGQLDVVYQLPPEEFSLVKDAGGSVLTIKDGAAMAIYFTFGQGRNTPLNDVCVRRAINMAVDRQTIVNVLLAGQTKLSSQPTVPEAFGYDPSIAPYPFDPAQAKHLLTEAGFGDGFAMTLGTSGGGTNSLLIVQRIADDLARVGIKVEVRTKPSTQYLLDFVQGRFDTDAFTLQWGAYPSLDAIQMTTTGSCRKTNTWYCDPSIEPTITAAWSETDPAKALALRHAIMRHYHDAAPSLFMYDNVTLIGLSPRTAGYDSVFGFIPYENVRLRE